MKMRRVADIAPLCSGRMSMFCLVICALVLFFPMPILAQDVDIDYRAYKFYDEDYDELLLPQLDSVATPTIMPTAFRVDDSNMRYALFQLGYRPRGLSSSEERYTFGRITLNRSVAKQLVALGVARDNGEGAEGALISGAALSTTEFLVGRDRALRNLRHTVRGEISGQNYLAGIAHRKTWHPSRYGVSLDGGWEINHSLRVRTGRDLYVDGVFSNAVDGGVEASFFNRRHSLSLAATLSYNNRGLRQSSTEEAYSLLNNPLYNPAWGMQSGRVRNSRVLNSIRPDIIALWDYRLTAVTTLHVAANIGFEGVGRTSLVWFDAITPMPDNYRYMPSYYKSDERYVEVMDAWMANDLKYTQIDWEGMYQVNMLQPDGQARYAVAKRRENRLNSSLSAYVTSKIADVDLSAGVLLQADVSRNFKVMDDLLGGEHILDVDYYLIDDATYSNQLHNNLLTPNRKVVEGDRFGYDYRLSRLLATLYGVASWSYGDGVVDAAITVSTEATQRRGFFEKELFPGEGSYGRSAVVKMYPYNLTARWNHYIDKHRLGARFMLRGASPEADEMFLQSEYNNRIVRDLALATTLSGELSYGFVVMQKLNLSAALFTTATLNDMNLLHYYDDLAGEYVDCVVSGINTFVAGFEAKANVEWSKYLSSSFMATAFASRYAGSSKVSLYSDSSNAHIATSAANLARYRTGVPELAAYGDLEFRVNGWMARAAVNYCGVRYVAPSFVRRSDRVLLRASSEEHRRVLLEQQRLEDVVNVDFSVAKWFEFGDRSLGVQLSVRNLLGGSDIQRGYEQNRVRVVNIQNRRHVEPFADRLTYGYPRTIYLSITLRM